MAFLSLCRSASSFKAHPGPFSPEQPTTSTASLSPERPSYHGQLFTVVSERAQSVFRAGHELLPGEGQGQPLQVWGSDEVLSTVEAGDSPVVGSLQALLQTLGNNSQQKQGPSGCQPY